MPDVTLLLHAVETGEPQAAEQLLPLVYEELRRLAAARMAQEQPGQTLQATALVHEAWLRLTGPDQQFAWNGRRHFFGAAAEAMRRILVDRARKRSRVRHGGNLQRVDLEHVSLAAEDSDDALLAMTDALDLFARESPQEAEIVRLRYFIGLDNKEIASALGVSLSTVDRSWAFARSWLHRELKKTVKDG